MSDSITHINSLTFFIYIAYGKITAQSLTLKQRVPNWGGMPPRGDAGPVQEAADGVNEMK